MKAHIQLNEGERTYINLPKGETLAIDRSSGVTTIHLRTPDGQVWNVQVTERLSGISLFTDGIEAYMHGAACGCDGCLGR